MPTLVLVHGWDRIKHVHVYSLLALSTHKNVKRYPTMTKGRGSVARLRGIADLHGLGHDGYKYRSLQRAATQYA